MDKAYKNLADRILANNEYILKHIISTDYPTIYNWENLAGTTKGRLYIDYYIGRGDNNQIYYQCQCECGNSPIKSHNALKYGHCNSCGCLRNKNSRIYSKYLNEINSNPMYKQRLYSIFKDMHQRVLNPNASGYENYGMKNIKICDEWLHNFPAFQKWALSNGYNDNLTLERKDYRKDYSPDNCEWVTISEQQLNKSANKLIPYSNYVFPVKIWADIQNLTPQTIQSRIRYEYPIYDILFRIPEKYTSYDESNYMEFNLEGANKFSKFNKYNIWIEVHPEYASFTSDDYKLLRLNELNMQI